MIFIYW